MTEVGSADLSRLLQTKRNEFSSIVTARKRKLRELYAVATNVDSIPNEAFSNPNVPPPTQAESQFLESNDILQSNTFDIATLPTRPEPAVNYFVNSLTKLLFPPPSDNLQHHNTVPQKHGASTTPDTTAPTQTPSATAKPPSVIGSDGRDTRASSAASPHSIPAETKSSVSSSSTSTTVAGSDARVATPGPTQGASAQSAKPSPKPASPAKQTPETEFVNLQPDVEATEKRAAIQIDDNKNNGATSTKDVMAADGSVKADDTNVPTGLTASEAQIPVPATQNKSQKPAEATAKPTLSQTENVDETTGNTAEDQLLQESLRSSMAPTATTADASPKPPSNTVSASSTTTTAAAPPTQAKPMEIPDSQEEDKDRMVIDTPSQDEPKAVAPKTDTAPPAAEEPAAPPKDMPKDDTEPPQRAVTRVSSGAMRLKSVSEIVGDTPRGGGSHERSGLVDVDSQLTPLTSTSQSPSVRFRGRPQSRGQASTVLFGTKPKRPEEKAVVSTEPEKILPEDDYFTPLFVQGFTNTSSWMPSMEKLLHQANKTIGTPDALLALQDHQACKVLRRVYHLQQNDKWSLRQPKRCPEPTRQATQWDVLLKEVKWMRTDFREERKWKMAAARRLAHACAEWVNSPQEVRTEMQVAAHIPPVAQEAADDVDMVNVAEEGPDRAPTPELVPSGDADSPQNIDDLADFPETVAPSAIFALQEDDVVFGLRPSPAADRLLEELPMYGPALTVPKVDAFNPDFDPDAHWRRPALPLSKYVEGEMHVKKPDRKTKRRRFDLKDEAADEEHMYAMDVEVHNAMLPPASDDVSLFKPDMKHTRDRLHTGHHFRPPSDSTMPLQQFYECRSPSQWTQSEDDELRSLVREFTYNWPLISNMLSSKSRYKSGAERRTPWECFERWINLEGLPADMGRTAYFKAYNNRIEAAQRVIMHQNQLAVQAASQSGGAITPMRRRPSTPIKVERRRNNKHLAMIDAMRKLAKKREATAQKQQQQKEAIQEKIDKEKQQQAAQGAKKPGDNLHGKKQTPREYSLLRAEREQVMQDRITQYAMAQEQKRRVQMQQARAQQQGQAGQAAGAQGQNGQVHPQNGQQVNHAGGVNGVNGMQRPQTNHIAAAAAAAQQGQQRMPMQGQANGMANGMNGMNGMPNNMVNSIANGNAQAYNLNNAMGGQAGQMNAQQQRHLQAALQAHQQQQRLQQSQQQAHHQQQQRQMGNQQQPDPSVMLRAQRMAEQQRQQAQAQQALHNTAHHAQPHQQHQQNMNTQHHQQQGQGQQNNPGTPGSQGTQGSPPMRNGAANLNQQSFINNAQAMIAQYNNNAANGGQGSPPANGMHMPSLAAGSPGQAQGQGQARHQPQIPNSITAQLAQLEASYRAKNPSLTPEQLRQLATENLTRAMMQQRQSAMNAAAGGAAGMAAPQTAGIANGMAATTSPHQYAALLRQQQQAQASQGQGQAQGAQSASPVPQATQIAHQRQSSEGSATPSGIASQNGISPNGVK